MTNSIMGVTNKREPRGEECSWRKGRGTEEVEDGGERIKRNTTIDALVQSKRRNKPTLKDGNDPLSSCRNKTACFIVKVNL